VLQQERLCVLSTNRRCLFAGFLVAALFLGAPVLAGDTPLKDESASRLRQEVSEFVRQLDSDKFAVRQQASAKLERLKARPETWPILDEQFQRILVTPGTSFEVRRQVERLRSGLPGLAAPRAAKTSPEEIDRLVRQLEDDRYATRLGATRRLEWLLGDPRLVCPILARLKERLNREELSLDAKLWIEPIYAKARGAWLTGDPATWDLPEVPDTQIAAWLDDLVRPKPAGDAAGASRRQRRAMRELSDLLVRDGYVPKIKQALESRLAQKGLPPEAARRLRDLADLTRPAMVAEFWYGRRLLNTQHLLIGVPSQAPGATRPSHFGYIDDDVAFCVIGQNLSQGNFPVGVAVPHPNPEYAGAMFHLVNLSTPRHKMAYEYLGKGDEGKRLAQLSRRTLARFLAARQRLSLEELQLLRNLDREEVSRFAGDYFSVVEDQAVPADVLDTASERPPLPVADQFVRRQPVSGHSSRHGFLCEILATEGTRAAIPGLLRAIRGGRFLPPTPQAPYQLPWIAALAIAARDPWPSIDAWLGELVGRADPLVTGRTSGPELGATAAGLLLTRHQQEPSQFGLTAAGDPLFDAARLAGYRFLAPSARERVERWWSERQAKDRP